MPIFEEHPTPAAMGAEAPPGPEALKSSDTAELCDAIIHELTTKKQQLKPLQNPTAD